MKVEVVPESHLDHGLSPEHVAFILATLASREDTASGFICETFELAFGLSPLSCGLYGPSKGDGAIEEADVSYVVRGSRKCASRVTNRPRRSTWQVTVIAGPRRTGPMIEGNEVTSMPPYQPVDFSTRVLYTAYGGLFAPREPGDASIATWDELRKSRRFWAEHALAM